MNLFSVLETKEGAADKKKWLGTFGFRHRVKGNSRLLGITLIGCEGKYEI